MPLTMYDASVPVFRRALATLTAILDKAEAHVAERQLDPSVLLQARLHEGMFPFVRQVQIATDHAKALLLVCRNRLDMSMTRGASAS
jgi:hypothetical protein